jgi:alpha-L-rhamnosidase
MEKSADVLGRADDARHYGELFERVKRAFNEAYVDADGKVRGDTQCAYALALSFELLDGETRERAAQRLAADIEARGGHFSTGFVGTKDLLLALNAIGREDLAYRLVLGRDYPGWLFEIQNGATSIWERWDGWTPERASGCSMNSFAHYAWRRRRRIFGRSAEPALTARDSHSAAAAPGGGLIAARAATDPRQSRAAWGAAGDELEVEVWVPPNVGATLAIPTHAGAKATEGGVPLERARGVSILGVAPAELRVEIGPGHYVFRCREPVLAAGKE